MTEVRGQKPQHVGNPGPSAARPRRQTNNGPAGRGWDDVAAAKREVFDGREDMQDDGASGGQNQN